MCAAPNDRDARQSDLIWFWFLNQGQLLLVGGLLVLLAVWQDASRREPRDWLHWTGVVVYLCGTVIAWSWVLWLS